MAKEPDKIEAIQRPPKKIQYVTKAKEYLTKNLTILWQNIRPTVVSPPKNIPPGVDVFMNGDTFFNFMVANVLFLVIGVIMVISAMVFMNPPNSSLYFIVLVQGVFLMLCPCLRLLCLYQVNTAVQLRYSWTQFNKQTYPLLSNIMVVIHSAILIWVEIDNGRWLWDNGATFGIIFGSIWLLFGTIFAYDHFKELAANKVEKTIQDPATKSDTEEKKVEERIQVDTNDEVKLCQDFPTKPKVLDATRFWVGVMPYFATGVACMACAIISWQHLPWTFFLVGFHYVGIFAQAVFKRYKAGKCVKILFLILCFCLGATYGAVAGYLNVDDWWREMPACAFFVLIYFGLLVLICTRIMLCIDKRCTKKKDQAINTVSKDVEKQAGEKKTSGD
eukprot:TRINITY_DN2703_c0_g1_i11.p1 TRINITY_DN2703_c0_g1~~TRINITY_DN2703_c0_g1_i11.p1  ORF type:complete len:398 (-),score=48.05 TRINITY_DN2703_c0_g1_i11:484-1650(-)